MKKTFYLFNPGMMERKDNTLKFTPFAIDEDGTEHPGQPRYLPVEDISEFYCFGSLKANSSLFNFFLISQQKRGFYPVFLLMKIPGT